ncbi:transcriptional protein SWT1 isoform X3 [Melanerpes formicivorus]|uniref:transcriptional protein SWT1 isoform X3 n=1 Tax=Melanerpes formicivorus TaxID=211600 RepID=UPI00358E9BB2
MSKKKLKKLTGKEDCLDGQDDKNSEDTRSYRHTMKGESVLQRFKIEKDEKEKKQYQSSAVSHGTSGRSQGESLRRSRGESSNKSRGESSNRSQRESPNQSKTTENSLIPTEKKKKIVIQFKAKEIKQGKSTRAAEVGATGRSRFDGTEGKKLWHSFELQRDKALKRKAAEKAAELCKLKLKAEKTMVEKFKSPVSDSHIPHRKAVGAKKQSEEVRIPKKPFDTSTRTVHGDRPSTKKPSRLPRPWEEESEEGYKEFPKKKHHMTKHRPSHYSPEPPKRWDLCKRRKTDADSGKATGDSGTAERDIEASCSKQSFEVLPPPQDSQSPEADQEMQIVEDLHVARVEKRMALPVVQTCGELTSMEIDLPEPDLNISAGIGRLALIIPWVVLQELDNLKKGKMLQHVRDKAIPAVQFIYRCLKNQDSKLWGQSMQLASQKMYGLSDENNDDRVLQCCLQYQNLFPQAVVVLCTDDKNLCNKAIVSEVKAFCKADLVKALWNLNMNRHQDSAELQQSKGATELEKTGRGDASLTAQFPNMLPDLEKNLGEALSCILETEMKIAYGNLWMEILYLKPPWTLVNLLKCYKKHWMAVFGYVVPRSLLSAIECLYNHLCTDKPLDSSAVRIMLQESKKLFHAFSSRSDYDGVLPQAYEALNKLYQMLTEVRSDSEQDLSEDIVVLSENAGCEKMEAMAPNLQEAEEGKSGSSFQVAQENRHQEIWSVLEGVWNTINLYSIEIFQKLDPNAVTAKPLFEEAFLGLQKLLAAVNDILEGISRSITVSNSLLRSFMSVFHRRPIGSGCRLAVGNWHSWSIPLSSVTRRFMQRPRTEAGCDPGTKFGAVVSFPCTSLIQAEGCIGGARKLPSFCSRVLFSVGVGGKCSYVYIVHVSISAKDDKQREFCPKQGSWGYQSWFGAQQCQAGITLLGARSVRGCTGKSTPSLGFAEPCSALREQTAPAVTASRLQGKQWSMTLGAHTAMHVKD